MKFYDIQKCLVSKLDFDRPNIKNLLFLGSQLFNKYKLKSKCLAFTAPAHFTENANC